MSYLINYQKAGYSGDQSAPSKLKTSFIVNINGDLSKKSKSCLNLKPNYLSSVYMNFSSKKRDESQENTKRHMVSKLVGNKILSSRAKEDSFRLNSAYTSSYSSLDLCNSTDSNSGSKCFLRKNSSISSDAESNEQKSKKYISVSNLYINGTNEMFADLPRTRSAFKIREKYMPFYRYSQTARILIGKYNLILKLEIDFFLLK